MGEKNKSILFISLLYLIYFFFHVSVVKLLAKEVHGDIGVLIRNGFSKVTINKSGSEYYDELLEKYAKHISNIRPFDHKKVTEYLNFINRNLAPYNIKLKVSCKDICTGFLSLKRKEISGEFLFGTSLKKVARQEDSIEGVSEYYTDPKFYPQRSYLYLNYRDLGLEGSNLQLLVGNKYHKNYQYEIKYIKSFQQNATSMIKTSISHNNIDYLADIIHFDSKIKLIKLKSQSLDKEKDIKKDININYQTRASNLIFDTHYKFLYKDSIEYRIGYSYRYTSYSNLANQPYNTSTKLFIKDLPKYHLNHVYGISKILNYGLVFIIGYESDFSNKYKHIASAMFYNKSLRNYFLDLTIFNSDRKWKNKCDYYKVDDFYSSAKISKEILVKNSIINSFAPYVILTYDNKSRKEQEKIVSKEKNIQQGVGFTIRTASDSRLKKVEADILYLNSKKTKSVLLTFNIKF